MEERAILVNSKFTNKIKLRVIPGHFVGANAHSNYYIDISPQSVYVTEIVKVAKYFATLFSNSIVIDTVVCLDGTEAIGMALASMLSDIGKRSVSGEDIAVLKPEINMNGQMMFRDNLQEAIFNKKILILSGTGATGTTINRCIDCINYYGGWVTGIAAIFSGIKMIKDLKVESIFTPDDFPTPYKTYPSKETCEMCKNDIKVDAMVNAHGYSIF